MIVYIGGDIGLCDGLYRVKVKNKIAILQKQCH